MAMVLKARQPASFGFIRIHRKGLIIPAARMGNVIDATAERTRIPRVDQIEGQRHMDRDGRMQAGGRLPSL